MTVITRFAPSPTGDLHIGGARTALFNYLYARANKGKFILRVEDTDRERSTEKSVNAILDGIKWLGLDYDQIIFQSKNEHRHAEIAKELLDAGKAFCCYTPQDEINKLREEARAKGEHFRYISPWRDGKQKYEGNLKPVIRIKAPLQGESEILDEVQGKVVVKNSQLDDMVLLRADGTPTYMLAVVVDDHDEKITHIIRGDDHLNNAFRQKIIYDAMGWEMPKFAHIPLIHNKEGKKLSKRDGALGIDYFAEEGYLQQAVFNYLLRLGWSHGNDEIISKEQAKEWFNIESLGKSPSKLDFDKLRSLNAHYIKNADDNELAKILSERIDTDINIKTLSDIVGRTKNKAKTLNELFKQVEMFTMKSPIKKSEVAMEIINDFEKTLHQNLLKNIDAIDDWKKDLIFQSIKSLAEESNLKVNHFAQYLRAAIVGTDVAPSIFDIMEIIGKQETLKRINS